MRNGFHEDGFATAVDVVEAMRAAAEADGSMTPVDHIRGETFHGRKGAVSNSFRYGVDYLLLDPEIGAGPRRCFRATAAT